LALDERYIYMQLVTLYVVAAQGEQFFWP
jgi:hypothetical protein